jgi:hypothetical protein
MVKNSCNISVRYETMERVSDCDISSVTIQTIENMGFRGSRDGKGQLSKSRYRCEDNITINLK